MSSSLLAGAWCNPWYTHTAGYPSTSTTVYLALASVTDWSQTSNPDYGFTKSKVDHFRGQVKSAKILISFGGSVASANLWSDMANDPDVYANKIDDFLTSTGADGIDYDYETSVTSQVSTGLAKLMKSVSAKGKGYIQTMSVLGGSYTACKPIIDANVLDYIIVMCYNGGMFVPGHESGRADWKGWMDLWVRDVGDDQKSKLVIGMCVQYNSGVKYYADSALVSEGVTYCNANQLAGIFFWWYSNDCPGVKTIGGLIDQVVSA